MPIIVTNVAGVTPSDVAVTLGRSAPADGSAEFNQWALWIGDAENLIFDRLGDLSLLNQANLAYVVREAVALKVKNPDPIVQTTTSVDDGSVSKRYEKAGGHIHITEAWWAMLTPNTDDNAGSAFSITPWFDQSEPTA
jgi:hypothetical protein